MAEFKVKFVIFLVYDNGLGNRNLLRKRHFS